ncbi:protein NatB [Clostridium pasteurianum DSM 525 = ATCC 6013]|uniref:Protein NatB n=1 Tax=Clostridium pasteurianum DSM 525 = ATCC 6013 TaxID=1262449 RepID=A0A0H3J0S9_CLOPA|nr:ABC transporter permease [Clostridium pasteurianum]AJA46949.1 protein NatB [Clostridium pasteurianum DSM 525 = ATCC 6013]AJA50937.1 protein NatB [Clostridium pasteurianum DSM 525 = ATCC 6013]AOZ74329.1 sodium ABC transporter [Clostridium pasteurianum DSM 525 = ATCC 6013]AOZ78127.1 sodium ABC transporter [Clostridium pasteurianum]ELP58198.1 Na+ ABC transporter NatB [Clostridium pasteurianum DSM 525 = ATCC 6013]
MNNTTITVFKKEIIDLFRDKKTILLSVLIPLIIFPIIFGVLGKGLSSSKNTVENNLKIALIDKGNSSLGNFIKSQKNVKVEQSDNLNSDIKNGKIYIAVEIPENFNESIGDERTSSVNITYDNSSTNSETANTIINSIIDAYSKEVVTARLQKRHIDTSVLNPIKINKTTVVNEDEGTSKLILSMLLPLILVLYSVTGPLSAAIDLGVGEKERGTLEPLLTTRAGRMSLLWGKFLAITVVGLMATIASIAGILIAIKQSSAAFGSSSGISGMELDGSSFVIIGILIVFLTMAFGALELAISIYARSFKEASTYTSPLIVIALVPTYATYMLDAKNISLVYFNIPLANVVCVLKELIAGIYNYNHIFITLGWILVYVVICILFARFMFSKEEVIFRS